jgi:hypothetical protein
MSSQELTEFERNARRVLEESLTRVDARTRSRLNQARHAALEAALTARRRPRWWSSFTLMPAAGAVAAALLVTLVLWHREPAGQPQVAEAHPAAVEDIDLLADDEALDLMEGWDGPFYEWAASQTDGNGESDT